MNVNIVNELKKQYIETGVIKNLLQDSDIDILDTFLDNWNNIEEFYSKYYKNTHPKVVICGINPGKNGAGKTGVPFVDFNSLSKLLPNVNETDIERSAQFFYEIIEHFGAEKFFETFYVTNISWVGFIQNGKNVNYYNLSIKVKELIFNIYKSEIDAINPTTIISLSQEVQKTNKALFEGDENIELKSLPHPNYCAFPKNKDTCTEQYISLLSKYIH